MSGFAALHSTAEWAARYASSGRRAVLSVGNFDGLHLGHQKILRQVIESAQAQRAIAAVITFDPHPLKVLRPGQAPPMVETVGQRLDRFAAAGLDAALVLRFDRALAALSPEEFVRGVLVEGLKTAAVLVGQNFRFGHRQAGNVETLTDLGRRFGFAVHIVDPVVIDGEFVSSTAVRNAVAEGRVAHAARLLGRPFALTGEIARGAGRGSTVLFPTLNLATEQELLPKVGVYATETRLDGRLYRSATNVGFRPTFDGTLLSVESHLFDFSQEVSKGRLEVRFWERLRDERKFSGPAELREQIAADLRETREYFRRRDLAGVPSTRRSCV
jgi:riboflavin kinase / FMN adenylyltransferase